MALPVTDAFSNRDAHVAEAARIIRASPQKTAVFKAVYHGKKARKSVGDIAKATGLLRKQVLDAGKPLARAGLFTQVSTNPVVYEKIEAIAHIRNRILSAAAKSPHSKKVSSPKVLRDGPRRARIPREVAPQKPTHDVFISHASEDKIPFIRDLAEKLQESGISVWYDKFSLKWGDKLRESIDRGLASSRFGIVVLSHAFFQKKWPKDELEGLFQLERAGKSRILPVWHNVTEAEVTQFSPMLAGRLAVSSDEPIDDIVAKLQQLLGES